MTDIETLQREHLDKVIGWARAIEAELAKVRERHRGEVHFRPSSGGVAMIGLRPERPQRGRSVGSLARLAANFEVEFRKHCVDCEHGRPTPEKRLQSGLLADAYRSERRLEGLLGGGDEGPPLEFVTDELLLPLADGKRIVCDLLALHGRRPVVIELKPAREMTRLVEQVSAYAALVEAHLERFAELFTVVLGRAVALEGPCERWIVWPEVPGRDVDPREDELAGLGIRVVGYREVGEGFEFRVGRRVETTRAQPI
jgi:hypothetical protein